MNLLDTSVAIEHLRGVEASSNLLRRLIASGEPVGASEVVRFELLAGVRHDQRDDLERFCAALTWVPVDEPVVRAAGSLARQYRRAYQGIDDIDFLIAGTALLLDADLLTTNVRYFPMFNGLQSPY
ncbi:MAG: PIN domain-containing protein [Chloroflexota bacterium]|nr:PIN domain-containing protein [Chloroflexota bacterium]